MRERFARKRRLWTWPLAIACVSTFGLVCALVADGLWDLAGVLSLGVPAALSLWLMKKARSHSDRQKGGRSKT